MRTLRMFMRKYKEVIVAVLLCIAGIGGLYYGAIPTIRAVMTAVSDMRTLDGTVTRLNQKAVLLESLSEDTLKEQLSVITSAIPVDKSVPGIFTTIDAVAAASGISVIDMSVSNLGSLATNSAQKSTSDHKAIGLPVLPFSITAKGSYEATSLFIKSIGTVRRLMRVNDFDMSYSSAGSIQTHVSVDAFYVPLPSVTFKTGDPLDQLTNEDMSVIAKISAYGNALQTPPATLPQPDLGKKQNPFAH